MLTFPSLCFHEQNLVIRGDGWATLNYWRAGVAFAPRPDSDLVIGLPHGAFVVAHITQGIQGGCYPRGYPIRCFYLSCLGPDGYIDGVDYPGKGDGGNLVVPSSVTPRVPQCERPTEFRRWPQRGLIE